MRPARDRRIRQRGEAWRHPDRRASARRRLIRFIILLVAALPLFAASQQACDRSVYYILHGNYDAALRQLEGAKTSGSSPAEVENLRGLALLLDGRTTEARASFDRALTLRPELAAARFNRGIAFLREKNYAKAAADLEPIASDEHAALRADAAYHLGIALDRLGRSAEAETWLDRALKLDGKLDAALLYSGILRERRNDLQGAGRAYLDYLKIHPDSTTAMLRLGLAAQKAGRADVAKKYLAQVIARAPQSAEAIEAQKYLVMWDE